MIGRGYKQPTYEVEPWTGHSVRLLVNGEHVTDGKTGEPVVYNLRDVEAAPKLQRLITRLLSLAR